METTLTLLVKSRNTAISGRVALALMKLGFHVDGQQYATVDDGAQARLQLRISGDAADHAKLFATISELPDVVAIEGSDPNAVLISEEETDQQALAAVSMLVGADFPDFTGAIGAFSQELEPRLRSPLLFMLGEQVGGSIYRSRLAKPADTGKPLEHVLNGPLARCFKPFSTIEVENDQFTLTRCPLAKANLNDGGDCCSFLTGFSKGILDELSAAQPSKVTKIGCRARGDSRCRFEVITLQDGDAER